MRGEGQQALPHTLHMKNEYAIMQKIVLHIKVIIDLSMNMGHHFSLST